MTKKIILASNKVEMFLTKHPSLRDDNPRLVVNIWHQELKDHGINITADIKKVLTLITRNLTSSETITRTSRLLQETNENLRGKNWDKRQAHTKNIKKEITELKSLVTGAIQ